MNIIEEIVSLLLCSNGKLKSLCISKSWSPQHFKHVNMTSLPVIYRNSSTAWMACDIFAFWLIVNFAFNEKWFSSQKTWAEGYVTVGLLCIPPFCQYPEIGRWKNYLPKNTTTPIQPICQGIVCTYCHDELLGKLRTANYRISEDTDIKGCSIHC
jgi:hypothetical protein